MMSISENYKKITDVIPAHLKIVAIGKTKTPEDILSLYECGHRVFGETRVQELLPKYEKLPEDIKWQMVGHLQRNKVKYIAPFVDMIQSVDSLKLLNVINKEGLKNNRLINCLFQMHIAEEETKFGMTKDEIFEILESDDFRQMKNISVKGVMGMATFTDNEKQIRKEFKTLKTIFDQVKEKYFRSDDGFSEISMGMSSDYEIAIEEGATMVRIGTALFGERQY